MGHRPERVRPREHKRLDSLVRHSGHDLFQKDCEHIVPRGNIATFSQKDEIRLALGHIGERRLAEACPPDKLWCTGLSACNLRLFPRYLALEHAREILREETITPLCNPILPKPGFHGSHIHRCHARLIRSLTFASIRPPIHPRVSPIRCPTTTLQRYVWPILNVFDAPSCLNKAPI